jgi:hypothetical protein
MLQNIKIISVLVKIKSNLHITLLNMIARAEHHARRVIALRLMGKVILSVSIGRNFLLLCFPQKPNYCVDLLAFATNLIKLSQTERKGLF